MLTVSRLASTFLFNAVWQVGLVAVAGLACTWLIRRSSAKAQHVVWVVALVSAALLPFCSFLPVSPLEMTLVPAVEGQPGRVPVVPGGRSGTVPMLLLAAYAGVLAFRLARLGWGCYQVRRVRRRALALPLSGPLRSALMECVSALGVEPAAVLFSREISGPATVGGLRAVVILPAALADETSPDVLKSMLGHELAHIRRHDYAWNLLYELLCLPIAVHPAAALMRRRVADSRELACDEMVSDRVLEAPSYARSLVDIAGSLAGAPQPAYSMGILDSDILEERVRRLVTRRAAIPAGKLIVGAVVLTLAASAWAASTFALRSRTRLAGVVVDASGGAVSGAQVVLRSGATGVAVGTLSSEPGEFRFDSVAPGEYRLEVLKPGFRRYMTPAFTLDGRSAARIRVLLNLGIVRETITVRG